MTLIHIMRNSPSLFLSRLGAITMICGTVEEDDFNALVLPQTVNPATKKLWFKDTEPWFGKFFERHFRQL